MFIQTEAVCQFEHLKLKPYHLSFMRTDDNSPRIRSTTVLLVQRNGPSHGRDGQVTLGETVMKGNARKVRGC